MMPPQAQTGVKSLCLGGANLKTLMPGGMQGSRHRPVAASWSHLTYLGGTPWVQAATKKSKLLAPRGRPAEPTGACRRSAPASLKMRQGPALTSHLPPLQTP